jgi:hypothetical protein
VAAITVGFGLVLIAVGGFGFVGTADFAQGQYHFTALIPAAMGLLFVGLGGLAFKEGLRKHAMHAAAALGLLGLIATGVLGLPKLFTLLGGGTVERPNAVYAQSATAVLCLVFVGLCVNSFVQARLLRRRDGPGS